MRVVITSSFPISVLDFGGSVSYAVLFWRAGMEDLARDALRADKVLCTGYSKQFIVKKIRCVKTPVTKLSLNVENDILYVIIPGGEGIMEVVRVIIARGSWF